MKEHKPKHTDNTANHCGNDRGGEQSKDTTRLIKLKWHAAKSLDERRDNEGTARIRHRKKCCAGKIAIAKQIGCESGSDHCDYDRPSRGRAKRHQKSRGDPRSRPEHRDAVRLVEQSEAKARGEKKNYRDCD
jgi:hypothetical protein